MSHDQRRAFEAYLYERWAARADAAFRSARGRMADVRKVRNPGTPSMCTGQTVDLGSASEESATATGTKASRETSRAGGSDSLNGFSACAEGGSADGFLLLFEGPLESSPLAAAYERGYVESAEELEASALWMRKTAAQFAADADIQEVISTVNAEVRDRYSMEEPLTHELIMYLDF